MITYQIVKTTFETDASGVQGRVLSVIWNAFSKDGEVEAGIYRRGTPIPADYAPADKPYVDVTEADCIAWVTDLEDQASIQSQIDALILEIEAPEGGSGLPWQDAFPLWAVGVAVDVGYVCTYKSVGYECIQAHTTESTWAPPATPALWKQYVPPSEGPQPWVQPVGSEDAYGLGAQVTHTGHLWTSQVYDNVWEPGVSQWTDEGVYP